MDDDNFLPKTIKLSNDIYIPSIGLGTYKIEPIKEIIDKAIRLGYRFIDTAKIYQNEKEIGEVVNDLIDKKVINRSEIFLCTKLWNDDHEDPITALKQSLKNLNLSYVDLFIIHWPIGKVEENKVNQTPLYKTWFKLEECVSMGLTKSIGVSNFNLQLLLDLTSYAKIQPICNQIELHPFLVQDNLVQFCKSYNIAVITYNPLNKGSYIKQVSDDEKYDLFKNPVIKSLCEKYDRAPAQIILNWHLYRGLIPIPKSSNEGRLKENLISSGFKMEENDYKLISSLDINKRFNDSRLKSFTNKIDIFA